MWCSLYNDVDSTHTREHDVDAMQRTDDGSDILYELRSELKALREEVHELRRGSASPTGEASASRKSYEAHNASDPRFDDADIEVEEEDPEFSRKPIDRLYLPCVLNDLFWSIFKGLPVV